MNNARIRAQAIERVIQGEADIARMAAKHTHRPAFAVGTYVQWISNPRLRCQVVRHVDERIVEIALGKIRPNVCVAIAALRGPLTADHVNRTKAFVPGDFVGHPEKKGKVYTVDSLDPPYVYIFCNEKSPIKVRADQLVCLSLAHEEKPFEFKERDIVRIKGYAAGIFNVECIQGEKAQVKNRHTGCVLTVLVRDMTLF